MVENDSYIYHLKKKASIDQVSNDCSLITQERIQKLDLLRHLIDNLTESLVICGPEGIGKTRLLKIMQDRHSESYHYCVVQGDAELNLKKILEQVRQSLKQTHCNQQMSVSGQIQSLGKKVVLIIDDAGFLVPGLITGITKFAAENPLLRVVFVLTHDDLYVKNRTDSAIEDCLFIEIPSLSENQCGEFLRYLSTKPWTNLPFKAINEHMIASIYLETHGIPGRIIAEVPAISGFRRNENPVWPLITAVAALVTIALGLQWSGYSTKQIKEILVTSATDLQQQVGKPVLQSKSAVLPDGLNDEQVIEANLDPLIGEAGALGADHRVRDTAQAHEFDSKTDSMTSKSEITGSGRAYINKTEQQSTQSQTIPEGKSIGLGNAQNDTSLAVQPSENYTLQVMTLSNEQSIKDILKKYQNLEGGFSYIKVPNNGKQRFVLFYGAFTSFELAGKAKQGLPPAFSQAVIKKINQVKPR